MASCDETLWQHALPWLIVQVLLAVPADAAAVEFSACPTWWVK
jgi:hypothetical protein